MINVVGSTPQPASPLPPDLPGELPTDPTQTNAGVIAETSNSQMSESASLGSNDSTGGNPALSDTPPPKKKTALSKKSLIAGLLLLLLVIGSGVGLYLMKLNQDLRQRAAETYGGGCSGSSDAQCQSRSPGARCGNNAPYGTCRALPNQEASDGVPCACERAAEEEEPQTQPRTPIETPVCAQVITPARNPADGECQEFPTPCDVPAGWEEVDSCEEPTPTPTEETTPTPTIESTATSTPTPTPTPTPTGTLADAGVGGAQTSQPTLPSQLPQTGPEDWLKYLQIGLGILGAGALLLLFL